MELQQTLDANVVIGRLGIGPGPAQAVPFNLLLAAIIAGSGGTFIATKAEAEAGTNNTQMMTPLSTAQSVAYRLLPSDFATRRIRSLARQGTAFTQT